MRRLPAVLLLAAILGLGGVALWQRARLANTTEPPTFQRIGLEVKAPSPLLAGDFDGDGRGDLVSLETPMAALLFSRGDGTFDPVNFAFNGPLAPPLVVVDMDHDRRADFFLPLGGNQSMLLTRYQFVKPMGKPHDNQLGAQPATGEAAPEGGSLLREEGIYKIANMPFERLGPRTPDVVQSGDFDGDRTPDLIVQFDAETLPPPDETTASALGLAGATPTWPRFYHPDKGCYASEAEAMAASAPAPVMGHTPVRIDYSLAEGSKRSRPLAHASALHVRRAVLRVGDFDGDGRTDFVRLPRDADDGGPALVYFSSGTGFRLVPLNVSSLTAADLRADRITLSAAADLDGDRKADLIVTRAATATAGGVAPVEIWLSGGDGGFKRLVPVGVEPDMLIDGLRAVASDVDGDGHPDLVLQDPREPGRVRLYRRLR